MKKCLGPFLLLSVLVILLFPMLRGTDEKSVSSSPAQKEGGLQTIFGPETFIRETAKPYGVNKVFSVADFEPPFILHVRSNRVSSARISMNGNLVLGPSSFSKKVTCFDLPVDPRANPAQGSAAALPPGFESVFPGGKGYSVPNAISPSGMAHLSVWMAGKPGSSLTIWIEGRPLGLRMVGPEGGRIEFPSGVVLDVPPNAVLEPTAIEIKELPLIEANAILNARVYSPQRKHLLGGFQAKPDGLTFNLPVKAIVPVAPLSTPGGIPFQAQFMLDQNKYWLLPTDLLYDPQTGTAEFSVQHFSGTGVVEIEQNEEPPLASGEFTGGQSGPNAGFGANLDWDTRDLVLFPLPGAVCEDPCRKGRQRIVSSDLDFTGGPTGECALVLSTATVTFLDCPGQPTVERGISDMTVACGTNVIVYFSGNFVIDTMRTLGTADIGYEYLTCSVSGSIQGDSGSMTFWSSGYIDFQGQQWPVYSAQIETLSVSGPEVSWRSTGGTISFSGILGTALAGDLTFIPGIPAYTIWASWPVYKVEIYTTN